MKVWKYTLEPLNTELRLPGKQSRPLSVGHQFGVPCLWAEVEPEEDGRAFNLVVIRFVLTGAEAPRGNRWAFLNTVQFPDGTVVHFYWQS